jgi:hypothetical protein
VTGEGRNSLFNVLGGVQFKDNSRDRLLKPFGYLMAGLGHAKTRVSSTCTPAPNCANVFVTPSSTETGFAGAFGGGLDIRLSDRIDIRAIQMDYNPVNLDTGMLHNVRVGIGIVIK